MLKRKPKKTQLVVSKLNRPLTGVCTGEILNRIRKHVNKRIKTEVNSTKTNQC